jgi:hypothetical protein
MSVDLQATVGWLAIKGLQDKRLRAQCRYLTF